VNTLVVDKTGTLTEGKPKLVSVVVANGFPENEVLSLAASLERGSEHPLASANVSGAQSRGLKLMAPGAFESVPGKGVKGSVDGRNVAFGNRHLMDDLLVTVELADDAERIRSDGQTAMFLAIDQKMAGIVASPTRSNRPAPKLFASCTPTVSAS